MFTDLIVLILSLANTPTEDDRTAVFRQAVDCFDLLAFRAVPRHDPIKIKTESHLCLGSLAVNFIFTFLLLKINC